MAVYTFTKRDTVFVGDAVKSGTCGISSEWKIPNI